MLSAFADQELDWEYEYKCREPQAAAGGRERCSQERFHTQLRYSRGGKGRGAHGAHRRRVKRSHI